MAVENTTIIDNYRKISLVRILEQRLWDTNGLAFAIQMMLMLILGHVFALSPVVKE